MEGNHRVQGAHRHRIGSSQSPLPNASSSLFLSPTAHKALKWGAVFFMALSALTLGYSFLRSSPLSLQRILRIGGGSGIGIGAVALGVLLCLPKQTPSTYEITHKNISRTKGWKENVEPQLSKGLAWRGWVSFATRRKTENCQPTEIEWDNNFNKTVYANPFYYIPVSVERKNGHNHITIRRSGLMKFAVNETYSYAEIQRGLYEYFSSH